MGTSQPPATRLGRLAQITYTRRWRVLALWILGLVGITVAAQIVGSHFVNKFGSGNSESAQAQNLLAQRFPAAAGDSANVVFHTTGPLATPANQAAVGTLVSRLSRDPHVSSVVSPFSAAGRGQIATNGHTAFATVQFDQQSSNLPLDAINTVINQSLAAAHPGFEVELGGSPIDLVDFAVPGSSEGFGVGAAMVILLIAFGSVVAMGLPIIVALFGIGIGFGLLDFLSHRINTPTFAPELAAMIGIGVGIDYALFIVSRYRSELKHREPLEAIEVALNTAGRAVLFAGTTVVISLLGLLLMGEPFVIGLALGAIGAVLLVMLGSMTLLPALLGFAGHNIDRLRVPFVRRTERPGRHTLSYRWSRFVQRHPWLTGAVSLLMLVVLAIPLFSMRQAFTDDGNAPVTLTTRKAYDLLSAGFGPGSNGPMIVAITIPPGEQSIVTRLANTIQASSDVSFVVPPRISPDGSAAVLVVIPKSSPEDAATTNLVQHLRQVVIPQATQGTGVRALVGGETAAGIDASTSLSHRLPLVIGLVVGLSFLLLMSVFRSLAVPIKAAVMNLLSIGAAYGVVVAIFQWGWLGGVVGIGRTGPIDPWVPLFLFTILFGLSMDYEVFLLSRIREEWLAHHENATAVADGLAATARVITAAAAIMICVFGSFVINDPLRVLKLFGLGLATAVFVDATLVRMVLVPATMELLGGANWWLPRWLDRILPRLSVEGEPEALVPEPEALVPEPEAEAAEAGELTPEPEAETAEAGELTPEPESIEGRVRVGAPAAPALADPIQPDVSRTNGSKLGSSQTGSSTAGPDGSGG